MLNYKNKLNTVKKVLKKYKNDDIYKYYYEFKRNELGFCSFEIWNLELFS